MWYALIALCLLLLSNVASADTCQVIRWKSWGNIVCYKHEDGTSVLIYKSEWVWQRVETSGQHNNMLRTLCAEKGTKKVREIVLVNEGDITVNTPCANLTN